MTNQSIGRNTSSTHQRFFSGISVKDYVKVVNDDFVDDGFVPADDDNEGDHTCDDPDVAASPTIECEAIESLGQQRLHVQLKEAGRPVWEQLIHADVEDEIRQAAREAAELSHQTIEGVEHLLASKVAEARQVRAKNKTDGTSSFLAGVMNTATFAAADCRREWLVKKLLVTDEPVLLGGPKKSLKTSVVVDLALSLGSGTRFLNSFEVPHKRRCLILSGESGQATLQDAARRVCAAKKIAPESCDVLWGFELPKLSRDQDLKELGTYVRQHEVKVVIIDPLYLCLMEAGLNLSTSNLFHTGPLLLQIAQACRDGGATPILVHHARKQMSGQHGGGDQPLDLDDLAFSGFAEFARQWLLISRRETYEPGTGLHKLWLNVGGSAGQSGLWGLDVDEGRLDTNFKGREWKVEVLDFAEVKQQVSTAAALKKTEQHEKDLEQARQAVLDVLRSFPQGETANTIRDCAACKKKLVGSAINALAQGQFIRSVMVKKKGGQSGEKTYPGWATTQLGLMYPLVASMGQARSVAANADQPDQEAGSDTAGSGSGLVPDQPADGEQQPTVDQGK